MTGEHWDSIVVGAGVFGAWTAERLRTAGQRVLLLDAAGPANARAASGGESRLIRGCYGGDAIYTRMAHDSLPEWRALSADAGLPIFHPAGVLFFFQGDHPQARDSIDVHRALGLPLAVLDGAELQRRWPQVDFAGVDIGIHEPAFGALMARRAVQTLVARFVRAGGAYRQAAVLPPGDGARLDAVHTSAGNALHADAFVFAAGPWLPRLFPGLLGKRIFPTRQEVYFFAVPPGEARFGPDRLPGWSDWNDAEMVYGFPDLEARGFKLGQDGHGPAFDPDSDDRIASAQGLAFARDYLARRFPALAGARLNEARVCPYENSGNGDFIVDRHPDWRNVVIAGAGSGHGLKHGPAVGRLAAQLVLDPGAVPEPRLALAGKPQTKARAVH